MEMRTILLALFVTISSTILGQDDPPPDIVFVKAEKEPSFPGGEKAWNDYLIKNLDANTPVKNGCPPGTFTIYIQFIVGRDSTIRDVRALTSHGYGMEEEAMKLIKKGPKWIPAMQNGFLVSCYRKQPITFVIAKQ